MPIMSLIRTICNFKLSLTLINIRNWYERSQNFTLFDVLISNFYSSHTDFDQTQSQLKIANVSDQTHISYINRGILPVRYDKATAGSENIEQCQILTSLIPVWDVNQTQTQLKIANASDQTHIRHID